MPALSTIEVWSNLACASGALLAVVPDAIACTDHRQLDGQDTASLTLPRTSAAFTVLREGRVLTFRYADGSFDEWRITGISTKRADTNELSLVVTCAPVLQDLLRGLCARVEVDGLTYFDFDYTGLTATALVDLILADGPAYFIRGTVTPTAVADFTFNWSTPLAALRALAAQLTVEVAARRTGSAGYYIDLVTAVGSAAPLVLFLVGKNVLSEDRTTTTDQQATRLYPRGAGEDGEARTIARALWRVKAKVAGVSVDLEDPAGGDGPAQLADQFNTCYLREVGGTLRAITDTVVVSATVTRLSVATTGGFTVGDLVEVRRTAGGADLTYLEDPVNVLAPPTGYGLLAQMWERTDLEPGTQNLVANPQLNGAYAGGLPTGWTKVGTPTTAAETGGVYTQRGGESCHVTAAANEGILSAAIALAPTAARPFFSAQVTVRIISGRVRFELVDVTNTKVYPDGTTGKADAQSTGDWWDIGIGGVDLNAVACASVQLRVVADGGAAEFYVDSAQLTQTADQRPFLPGDGARLLWQAANQQLLLASAPYVTLALGALDLERLDPRLFPYEALVLGGTVTLRDDAGLNLTVSTRITTIERDLLQAAVTTVTLSNRPDELTDAMIRPDRRRRLPGGGEVTDTPLVYSQCLAEVTATTATTVTVTVTASAYGGTPTVQLVGVTGSATLLAGAAIGVPVASGSVWVFNRGAALGGSGQAQFRAVFTGTQSDDDFVEINEVGRDTVPLQARARVIATDATTVTVRLAVADPYPQGANSATIAYADAGTGGVAPASGGTVTPAATLTEAAGTYIDYVITRPLFGTATGRVTFNVTAANRTSDSDAVDVPARERDTVGLLVRARVLVTAATTVTVRVAVADPYPQGANSATIAYQDLGSGGVAPASPQTCTPEATLTEAAGTYVDFTITRPVFGNPTARVTFTATAAGRTAQTDAVDVPTQDQDTIPLSVRARVTASDATTVTVRVAVADPYPQGAASASIAYQDLGSGGVAPASPQACTPAATLTEAAGTYVDFVVTRPAFGAAPGRVTFTVTAAGRVSAQDALDVLPSDVSTGRLSCKCLLHDPMTGQVIPNNTPTDLTWIGADYWDVGGLHDPGGAHPERITVPATGQIAGVWVIIAEVYFVANATGTRDVSIAHNTLGEVASAYRTACSGAHVEQLTAIGFVIDPPAGSYFTVNVTQTSGGNLNCGYGCTVTCIHLF